jgi:hypothetical protein
MEAATSGKAGNDDVAMIQNLFIISKVRQAYEMYQSIISADTWIEAGSPETESIVFGITDLHLNIINQTEHEAELEAEYLLWMPKNFIENNDASQFEIGEREEINSQPISMQYTSSLTFTKRNDVWYISEIIKETVIE